MKDNLISIIVPIYNRENQLDKCIESIINQSYKNIEIILVNDGSKDNSLKKCIGYKRKDNRIKIINKDNGGVSSARNRGIREAKGDFIQFVDSDDYLELNMCEILIDSILSNDADIIVCGNKFIRNKCIELNKCINKTIKDISEIKEEFSLLYSKTFFNSPCNKLYKKEIITTYFDENLSLGEDLLFNLANMRNANKIIFIENCLYNYVKEESNSLTNNLTEDKLNVSLKIYNEVNKFCNYLNIDQKNRWGVDIRLINNVIETIQMIVNDQNLNLELKIKLIFEWLNNKTINKVIYGFKYKRINLKITLIILRTKIITIIYPFFKLRYALIKLLR